MLIHNYGLFWRRENIFWGRPRVPGHLKGFPARKSYAEVDFREQRGVYVLYDDNFRPVYVGQAGANDNRYLFDRLKDHTRDALADRWTKFSWFGIRWVTKADALANGAEGTHTTAGAVLDHIEAILISTIEPAHNRQAGRFGDEVDQYLQVRDEELGPDHETMIRQIWQRSQELAR
jgi:hypothetical protein